ncbi:MAG: WD40 repeat protein [Candidatus Azotimanducaceae bacterium]|jgi:WD40 repeat protein
MFSWIGCVAFFLLSPMVFADGLFQVAAGAEPGLSFDPDVQIEFEIEAAFSKIRRERDKSASYPGRLTHAGQVFDVSLSPRGNTRLNSDNCRYPPLWIDFDKADIKNTVFGHQKHVKLVVLCRSGDKYRDYVRGEYIVYKMLNLLTPHSFQVRWASVTYHDDGKIKTEPAFFIERKARLAKRNGLEKVNLEGIEYSQLAQHDNAVATLFQYIVANPDYSFVVGNDGDCCHNAKLFKNDTAEFIPVPYDFDSSGIVNASYAVPAKHLGIRKTTTRVYRGHCMHNDDLQQAREKILATDDQMIALLASDAYLRNKTASKMAKYLSDSLTILRSDELYESEILDMCRSDNKG